ncbi:MAG TPA: hypothetical protein RMF84_20940, partial [Polyangiaceae bacterium LLY-WYZ-14_1]|nr:hypothetical protein [Polyangiaceae bacterium LLY-WYZ-14_1]
AAAPPPQPPVASASVVTAAHVPITVRFMVVAPVLCVPTPRRLPTPEERGIAPVIRPQRAFHL